MAEVATETVPIQTETVTPPVADATVLLGTETPAATEIPQQQTETQPADAAAQAAADAAAAEAAAKVEADKAKPEGAPEKYEFKAPEGQEYDSNLLSAFEAAAKDANLPQDAAQKLLDKMAPQLAERQGEQVLAIRKDWFEQSKADKEFGGDKLEVNLAIAKKALDTFGTPELNKLLVSTGLGNHPEMIRLMFKAGKAISEDSFVPGGTAPTSKTNAAAVLYDKTT